MRTHVVHWGDVAPKLPFGSEPATKKKRRELFEACDPRGIGLLSHAEVVRYYFRLLPPITGVMDTKLVLELCFRVARETVKPVVHIGFQQLDRNQFRVFLMSIWYYIKLWEIFCTIDESGERIVTIDHFIKVLPAMAQWGFGEVDQWLMDPEPAFQKLDRSGCGEVTFDELAEFCLRHGTPKLSELDDDEERTKALSLLTRIDPNLAAKVAPEPKYNGSVPPVPPPGQKLPPSGLPPSGRPSPGNSPGSNADRMKRWSSQYRTDYMPPSRRSSQPGSTVVSALPTPSRSRALSRAGSKESVSFSRNGEPIRDIRRQQSMPTLGTSIAGDARGTLDRNELRSKLEQNLGMYSTNQMRRILEVAGGMVVSPKA